MKRLLLFALALSAAIPTFAQKRAFSIEDLYRVKNVGELTTTDDGSRIAFTVTTRDLPRAKSSKKIWIANVDGSDMHAITNGEGDGSPAFSHDGKSLAFVRDNNIYILSLSGGEAKKLTDFSTGASDPLWAPNGKSIVFTSDVYPECGADDACNKKIADRWTGGKLKAHMADNTLMYRHWTAWRDGQVTHTFLVNVDGGKDDGKIRDLTPGTIDFPPFQLGGPLQYDFSPDSTELCVVAIPEKHRETSTNNDLYTIALNDPNAKPRNITASNPAYDGSPKYSPDGKYIAYRMQKQPAYESDLIRAAVYDRATGQSRVLTEDYKNWIDETDWSEDSKSIYVTGPFEGINPIRRVDVATGKMSNVFSDKTVDAFRIARDGKSIVYIGRSVGEPSEIYRADLNGTPRKKLSHFNDDFVRDVDVRPAETMWVNGALGSKIEVFIVKPHGFDPAKKYPLILNVHGGPQQMWGDSFRGDWQVYPGAGYVVAFPNPHGSTGYGQDFTAEISGDWGGAPFDDLMKVTDALEKLPYVDATRMGAMGWSYGGYMMDWFEGHTTRFKAIASMMGVYDLRAMYSATEELWFPEWDLKGLPWNSPLYAKWSPSNFVTSFKTPCLVISGERDYRVPYTQSLEFYTDLQKMNVPSRLFIFNEAGHWPSWYEMALYYTAHLEWFHQYLGGGPAPWSSEAFLRNAVFNASGERIPDEKKAPEVTQGKVDVK